MEIYTIEKSRKSKAKNCKSVVSKTVLYMYIYIYIMGHGTIQLLDNVVHHLNMKMKGKSVERIDLRLCSSLKWDGVKKKGTSWSGTRQ